MVVHLVDGTYELFRHFYGQRRFNKGEDKPFAAMVGVLHTVLQMVEKDATHIGVATDHVIESFRNALWPGYKTGEGIEPALWAQFHPLERALAAMGVAVWPMVELEADDALASAAHLAIADARVQQVCIWTPDKDLAQCVQDRVVQVHRKSNAILDAAALGFLGLGAQPPTPEWGSMLASALEFIQRAPWVVTFPGLAILVTVLAFNLVGDGLRDALDPKLRS